MRRHRPNVWIVHQNALPPGGTGITRHADLAKVLRSHGFDVTIIASNFNHYQRGGKATAATERVTEHDGIKFVWVKSSGYRKNGLKRAVSMVSFYLRTMMLRIAGKVGKPDVVIGSSPQPFSALAGLHLARLHRARFALELRDVWPDDLVAMGALRAGGFMHRAFGALSKHLESNAERIISAVPDLSAHLKSNGVDLSKVVYVPNGVFLNNQEPPEDLPKSLEKELAACADSFIVMYLGTHGQAHGLHNVLAAAQLLRGEAKGPKVTFMMIGGGQMRDELVAAAKEQGIENVRFHPPISKRAVGAALSRADAYMVHLAPVSTFEAYGRSPNKLYEYLAAAKPVLYSTDDQSSIVAAEGAGMIFKPGDPQALADAVIALTRLTPEERADMGRRGRAALEGRHDLSFLGAKLADMVTGLLSDDQRTEASMAATSNS